MGESGPVAHVMSPRVRRVGQVVHARPHARSAYIARLLTHLESVGFAGAPRWVGRSADGDDMLSFIDGDVLDEPPYNLDDDQLIAAAELIRDFHDCVAGTDLCAGEQTVCHGDLGPHNTIFRAGRPIALIDWDVDVRPGRRSADSADAVWSFTDLTSTEVPVGEQARRVALMCSAYLPMTPAAVVDELADQFDRARARHRAAGRQGAFKVFDGLLAWLHRNGPRIAPDRCVIDLAAGARNQAFAGVRPSRTPTSARSSRLQRTRFGDTEPAARRRTSARVVRAGGK